MTQCSSCSTDRIPVLLTEDLFPRTQTSPQASALGGTRRLVGRTGEHIRLVQLFDATRRDKRLSFVLIVGSPGSGKTRLVQVFSQTLAQNAPSARILTGEAGQQAFPFGPFAQLLRGRFGIAPNDPVETAREKIIAGVSEVVPASKVAEMAHLIAHLMRVEFPGSPILEPLAESPKQLETRIFIAVRRFLAADAERGPLVLCIDELERAGAETINLLHYLAEGLVSSAVMLIAVGRHELRGAHPSFGHTEAPLHTIELGPLDPYQSESLFCELLREVDDLPAPLVEHAKELGGSPRALFELACLLFEASVFVRGSAGYHTDLDRLRSLPLPRSCEEILSLRLQIISRADREMLERAAVTGFTFWLEPVLAMTRYSEGESADGPPLEEIARRGNDTRTLVAQALTRLIESGWIVESRESQILGEAEYQFAYPRLWDVVYSSVEPKIRRTYHALAAQWLELLPEESAAKMQSEIGKHLEGADEKRAAALHYRRAADTARLRYENDKAIRLFGRALECLGDGDRAERIHLWHDLGSIYELIGDFDTALEAFERMLRLTWTLSSRTKTAVALNKMGRVYRRKGELALALEYLERGARLFEDAGDDRGIASSLDDTGQIFWMQGRYDEAYEKITEALARRGQCGDKRSIAHSLSTLGNLQQHRGKTVEAEKCHREALDLRRQIQDRAGVIASLNNLAVLAYERGDKGGARQGWEQALKEAEEIGALPLQAMALCNLGELALAEGKQEEARRRIEEAIALARELDDRRLLSEAMRNLGLVELAEGNSQRAEAFASQALAIAEASSLRDYEGRALVALGMVHSETLFDAADHASERASQAEGFFRRGVDLFRQLGNASELARGLEHFGRYKLERGDIQMGRGYLEEAHRIFSHLGMKEGETVTRVIGEI